MLVATQTLEGGSMTSWIIENKEWLFSGIAIAIPIALLSWIFSSHSNRQTQKGGKNSTNIQIGGDVKFEREKNDK